MKNILYLFVLSMFLLSSCGNSGHENKENQQATGEEVTVTEEVTETDNGEVEAVEEETEISTCDEFLDRYEAWVDDYLDLLEKFKKNPADPDLSQKYLQVTNELADWSQEWFKYIDCNDTKEYEKRFEAISDKVDKKMKELGYE